MFDSREFTPVRDRSDSALLLSRVSFLTIYAVACTAAGSAVCWLYYNPILALVGFLGSLGMLFACNAVARRYPLNLAALGVFAFLLGLGIAPTLIRYAAVNGPLIIVQAAALSVVVFAMVGTLGYTSARSYANWLPWLMGGLFALILVSIVFWFVTASPAMYWLYAVAGTLIFVAFTFVDFTRIRHDYTSDDYIPATIAIYLDLVNLFLFILRLLGGRSRN